MASFWLTSSLLLENTEGVLVPLITTRCGLNTGARPEITRCPGGNNSWWRNQCLADEYLQPSVSLIKFGSWPS